MPSGIGRGEKTRGEVSSKLGIFFPFAEIFMYLLRCLCSASCDSSNDQEA